MNKEIKFSFDLRVWDRDNKVWNVKEIYESDIPIEFKRGWLYGAWCGETLTKNLNKIDKAHFDRFCDNCINSLFHRIEMLPWETKQTLVNDTPAKAICLVQFGHISANVAMYSLWVTKIHEIPPLEVTQD